MKYLDLTLPTPAKNLACDEALLDWCEAGGEHEILRFWQPAEYFVIVGYANKVAAEVNLTACQASGVPVFRRCSGGGTVLQGPGCLNYALILKIDPAGPLRSIASANCFIMERNRAAIEALLNCRSRREEALSFKSEIRNPKPEMEQGLLTSAPTMDEAISGVTVQGHTDLVIGGRKCSGNSQRRKCHWLLFHGAFLLNLDIALVERYLLMPAKQPAYRRSRGHRDFLTNLRVPAESAKAALRQAWNANDPLAEVPRQRIEALARQKYATREWNFRFPD
jgi:lipoate-protein ligase A